VNKVTALPPVGFVAGAIGRKKVGQRGHAFAEFAGFAAGICSSEQVMVQVAQPYPECLPQGGGREGVEDLVGQRSSITVAAPGRLTSGLDQHGGSPAGTAVRDMLLGSLGVGTCPGMVAEQETGFGEVHMQLGGVEAKAAGLIAVWVGRQLILGRRHHGFGFAATCVTERSQRAQLTPGQNLRPTQRGVGILTSLAGQIERFGKRRWVYAFIDCAPRDQQIR
jgi:hypothetical protein